jgi:predicted DNA-binding transcriptional regulator YafY
VSLRYRSERSQVTERTFDPYGVVYHGGAWYTIGYCHLRQGQRVFRLERIQHIELTGEAFIPPADFQALEAVQRALATVPSVWQVKVWLETTLEHAQHQTRLTKAYFEEVDNGVIMRGDVDSLEWAASFFAGLGVPFIIYQPPQLRAVLRQYALRLANYTELGPAPTS